jgi:Flp pilus assembly protein TadG
MKLRNQRGASAVEFAILLPVLVVIVFGIIEFGFLMFDKAIITNASREGARFGIVYRSPYNDDTAIKNKILSYCKRDGIDIMITFGSDILTAADITITPDYASRISGTPLYVTVTYQYDFLTLFFVPSITLKGQTVMNME